MPETPIHSNGWKDKLYEEKFENQQRCLESLERRLCSVEDSVSRIRTEDIPAILTEVAKLKMQAGIWGAVSGAVITIGTVLLAFFTRVIGH